MKLSQKAERMMEFVRKVQDLESAIEHDASDLGFTRNIIDLRTDRRAFAPEHLAQILCWEKSDILKETLNPFVTLTVDDVCQDMIDQNKGMWLGLPTANIDMTAISGDVSHLPERTDWKPYDGLGVPDVIEIARFLDSAYGQGSREAVRLMTRCAYSWLSHGMGYKKASNGILECQEGPEGIIFHVQRREGTDDLWWKFEVEFLVQSALSGVHLCAQSIEHDSSVRLMDDCMKVHKIVTAPGTRLVDSHFTVGDGLCWMKVDVSDKEVSYGFSEEMSIHIQEFPHQ